MYGRTAKPIRVESIESDAMTCSDAGAGESSPWSPRPRSCPLCVPHPASTTRGENQ